jgi:hypothetical protein
MNISLLSTSAEVDFEQEDRVLLRRRSRVMFALGSVVTAGLLAAVEIYALLTGGAAPSSSERWAYVAYLGVFMAGFIAMIPAPASIAASRATTFGLLAALLLVFASDTILNVPNYPPLAIVALILFSAAALIPWNVTYQAGLVLTSLVAVPVMRVALNKGVGSSGWWSWPVGQADPGSDALFGAIGVALLGAVSMAVSRTLYRLHRRARAAECMGGYRLIRPLGEGGMGTVWLAEHGRMCRPSAVKVVTAEPQLFPHVVARFQREIEVASKLDHPNTIEIRDFGRADDSTFFFAMEFLTGLDLRQLVERFGPVEPERAVYVLQQVCNSLEEAHSKGIVHRDLKPSNIFVTRRGGAYDFVKVLDFGLAREVAAEGRELITRTGVIVGTPHFMAPEAAHGAVPFGPKGDLYSLGCTAYWMLAGSPPFDGSTPEAIMTAHITEDPVSVRDRSELEIPRELGELVMDCLAKDPDERPQSVQAVQMTLASIEFKKPWSVERAAAWWNLHLPAESFS